MKRRGGREWATVVLLPLVWIVGVVLLWRSRAWTRRDKIVGTLLVPGGLAWAFYAAVDAVLILSEGCEPKDQCMVGISVDPAGAVALVALTVLPLASAVYLAIRADRTRPR